jgi:gamma-tubulin complex component 3
MLVAVTRPIYNMMHGWVMTGDLADPYGEFFVEAHHCPPDQLWHGGYDIRGDMLPSFIRPQLADKVMDVGR